MRVRVANESYFSYFFLHITATVGNEKSLKERKKPKSWSRFVFIMLKRGKSRNQVEMLAQRGNKLKGKLCSSISILVVMGLGFVSACPSDCVCKWKGGKQTVECVNRGLRTFPHNIDPGTQVFVKKYKD